MVEASLMAVHDGTLDLRGSAASTHQETTDTLAKSLTEKILDVGRMSVEYCDFAVSHSCMHTRKHTHRQTQTHTHTHTHTHSLTLTLSHTHTHTYTHTHTHTHNVLHTRI